MTDKQEKQEEEEEEEEGENVLSITYGFAVGKKYDLSTIRLRRYSNLILNPMVMVVTLLIEFYAPDYLQKVALRAPSSCTGSRGSQLGPEPHGGSGGHVDRSQLSWKVIWYIAF